ncbi:phage protein Gp27 family protein [Shinella sp. BYT-45]|uniref:phage protein Gp27 family protein n=1 Tax=Shinella sp. BYT-45 TaxID=3377377 RepID=UPI00397F01F1
MADDRRLRGRLSSLEMLPEEAQDDVIWAVGQLNERRRTTADILFELNDRLEAKGIPPISKSAFYRRSARLAKRAMQLEERRYIYAGIADKLTPEQIGKDDIVLGEFLKTLIDELLDASEIGSKGALDLARAYKEVIVGQRHSSEHRRKAEELAQAKLEKAVDEVAQVVRKAGVSQETMDEINRRLGVL